VHVFEDVCPHRLAPLSLGSCEGDQIRCGYHGWVFNSEGECTEIPALGLDATLPPRAKLRKPEGVATAHGLVFIAIETPLTPAPTISVQDDESFMRGDLPVLHTRGCAGLLADNFLDMAHFPFVHASTFGADEAREVPHYEVVRNGFGFEASYQHEFSNREDPGVAAGLRPLQQTRRLTYRYIAPFHLELAIEFLDAGGTNVIGFFLTPQDRDTVRIYSSMWRNDVDFDESRMQEAIDFELAVVAEDLALQSQYAKLQIPLDVTREVHIRADKSTLELRRVLRDFVEATL
jgi:vanillate O-demethylase monooxygenase subunit